MTTKDKVIWYIAITTQDALLFFALALLGIVANILLLLLFGD